jgi:hypothetical protein
MLIREIKYKKSFYRTYLRTIENSLGCKLFRNCFVYTKDGVRDILKNGELSCAYFVSSILYLFKLIDFSHTTVETTISKMQEKGWFFKSDIDLQPGEVIVWEKVKFQNGIYHLHIGFYIGNNKAISHDDKVKAPKKHDFKFNGKRNIKNILTFPSIENI